MDCPYRRRYETPGSTRASLIDGLRTDQESSWRRLMAVYAPQVYRWARRMGVRTEDAIDVGQEVFRSIAEGMPAFRRGSNRGSFRGWIRTITKHSAIDFLRRQGREPILIGGDMSQAHLKASCADANSVESITRYFEITQALDAVRPDFAVSTWLAFELTVLHERSAKDVADEIGLSPNAVYVARSRVLSRVREYLTPHDVARCDR